MFYNESESVRRRSDEEVEKFRYGKAYFEPSNFHEV
jgi:hypothetical protein